jgi:shikimate kinase
MSSSSSAKTTLVSVNRIDLPFKNLLITGFLGVGKTTIGRAVAKRLGVDFFDLDEEIEMRELMSIAKLREQYGDSRLKSIEYDLCRQAALMRKSVLIIPGAALLEPRTFGPLTEVSTVVCLTCELGEAMRRLHLTSDQQYRDAVIRRRMLSRLRREYEIVRDPNILQLDTTHLATDEEMGLLIKVWATGHADHPAFHMGPKPAFKPLSHGPMGVSSKPRVAPAVGRKI